MVTALPACGRIAFEQLQAGDGDAAVTMDGASTTGDGGIAGGSGMISGSGCGGQPFSSIAAAYVVGNDEYSGLPEVLLFGDPIPCAQLCATAWDDVVLPCQAGLGPVPSGVQFVRLTFGANTAGTYTVSGADPPAATEVGATAYVTDTATGGSSQCWGTTGTVLLTSTGATGPASGSFAFDAPGASLMGTFTAEACPSGWYP
jgi:hypothetical protein